MITRFHFFFCLSLTWGLACSLPAHAQYDYNAVEANTQQLFVAQDWKKLLANSQEALSHGTDFYDLRLRRAIAYISQAQYRLAIPELQKAQRFFPADTASRYYLCLAHDLLGNANEAQQYANTLPAKQLALLGKRRQAITEVGLYGSQTFFDSEQIATALLKNEVGEWNAYRGLTGGGVYVNHTAGKRIAFSHNVSSFSFQNFKKINYPTQRATFFNNGLQVGVGSHILLSLPHQWQFNLSLQYNHINSYTQNLDNKTRRYSTASFSKGGFSIGGYAEKGYKNVDFLGGAYWNNFLGYYTLQETGGLAYYPFGNSRLAFRAQFSALQNLAETNPNFQVSYLFFGKITAQIFKKVWLSGSYMKGDNQNFFDIENNAIYYTSDRTKRQMQASLFCLAGKHLRITASYTFTERSSDQFVAYRPDKKPLKPIAYFAHQIGTAIAWQF